MCGPLAQHNKPDCIFLSACFAQTVSDAFVDVGVPHIITVTSDYVLDKVRVSTSPYIIIIV